MGAWWLHLSEQENNNERAKEYFDQATALVLSDGVHKTANAGISLEDLEGLAATRTSLKDRLDNWLKSDLSQNEWRREDKQREREDENEQLVRTEQFRTLQPRLRENTAPPHALEDLAAVYSGHDYQASGDTPRERLGNFLNNDAELVTASLSALRNTLLRDDLPSVQEIVQSHSAGKRFRLSLPLLVGIELLFESEPANLEDLSDDLLLQALVSQYAYGSNSDSGWFDRLVVIRPELVAQACVLYVQGCLKARRQHVDGTYELAYSDAYANVAKIGVPLLLKQFPHRANLGQLPVLECLLKAGLRHLPDATLESLISEKLALESLDSPQRTYWMAAGLTLQADKYEAMTRSYVAANTTLTGHFGKFFHDRLERSAKWREGHNFSESSLTLLIELLGPGSTPERPVGAHVVTASMRSAELVRTFISQLAATATPQAGAALLGLETLPALDKWSSNFRYARLAQQVILRDTGFRHPRLEDVANTLHGGTPANPADVAAIVNEVLSTMAKEMRRDELNIVRQFWGVDSNGQPASRNSRPENVCRDLLVLILREKLSHYKIQCATEARHNNDKRSDIWCTHGEWGIPVEIKKDSNDDIWKAMDSQLIAQYSIDPRAGGFGIYLVLWFGGGSLKVSPAAGKKPVTAEEMKARLDELVDSAHQRLISVIVLDCSLAGNVAH